MSELAIAQGARVTLHFSLRLENGDVIDSTFDKKPATFTMPATKESKEAIFRLCFSVLVLPLCLNMRCGQVFRLCQRAEWRVEIRNWFLFGFVFDNSHVRVGDVVGIGAKMNDHRE